MDRKSAEISVGSGITDEFTLNKQRFDALGMDFGGQLDEWAKRSDALLQQLNIDYPKDGSSEQKWSALRKVFAKNRIDSLSAQVKIDLEALNEGHAPHSGADLDSDKLEQKLAAAERENPEFKVLIADILKNVQELRGRILDLR